MIKSLPLGVLLVIAVQAQSTSLVISGTGIDLLPLSLDGTALPSSVTYLSYSSTITVSAGQIASTAPNETTTLFANGTTPITTITTAPTATLLVGTKLPSSTTAGSTNTAAQPANTQPCNQYTEFCNRSYSNITYIAAHNSPFSQLNNIASNQVLGLFDQLDDGVRMLQGQTHLVNNTVYYCHTSCDLLNAGTAESYFANIATWLAANPYEVVTILIANGGYINVDNFIAPIRDSGLGKYAYTPPTIPMSLQAWPTLGQMILRDQRAVIFMDYAADQIRVPYILDQFSQMWETPFDPTSRDFPCTIQRPPGISRDQAEERMYLMNHNLNADIKLLSLDILIPNTVDLFLTNAVTGYGSLGMSTSNCAGKRVPVLLTLHILDNAA